MRRFIGSFTLLVSMAASASAQTVLKFDDVFIWSGVGLNQMLLTDQYAGLGISFVGDAHAFCLNTTSVSCSNTSWGSGAEAAAAATRGTQNTAMYWGTGTPIMNSSTGFTTGFSFFYSNPTPVSSSFDVYSGLDGSGELLASFSLAATPHGFGIDGCFGTSYCPFVAGGVTFAGTAHSVVFRGGADAIVYDDITFGSATPGTPGTTVPEPSTFALMAASLLAIPAVRRMRHRS